jgi:hypothetical protein
MSSKFETSSRNYFARLKKGEVLPAFHADLRIKNNEKQEERQRKLDIRTDIMATILAAYPTTPTKKLAEEFNVSEGVINAIAQQHGITKAGRRGRTCATKVEKVDSEGKVVVTYDSVNKAAQAEGVKYSSIRCRIDGRCSTPLNGFTYRLKKSLSQKPKTHYDLDLLQEDFDDDEFFNL